MDVTGLAQYYSQDHISSDTLQANSLDYMQTRSNKTS